MQSLLLVIFAVCLAVAASAGPRTITPGEMASWPIVCDAQATESEHYAAGEFQTLYRGLTGTTLPIVEQAPGSGGAVFIGPDAVAKSGRAMPKVALDEEGLRIRLDADALCIDGGRPRGTLYGVYEFFEEFCGVRYLTADHTYIPPNAAARKLPIGARSYVPQFKFRWSFYGETNRNQAFAARLRTDTVGTDPKVGGKTGYQLVSHNVAYLVPPAKYGKEHPEYYAIVNGKRLWDTTEGGGPQLCLTNPHVRDIVVQSVLEEIRKHPELRNINIAQMDNGNYCTCPKCAALDKREESHAGTMIAFVNAVAEQIEKTHSAVLLSTYAYSYTRKPPKTLKPRRNVMIQLCSIECCDLHAIDDPTCAVNRAFARDMEIWNSKCDKLFIWHYNTDFAAYMLPFPNLQGIGRSVDYFAKHSGRGVFMQAAGNGHSTELSDLRNYVMSRCLWKPGRDSWAETQEFCKLHYGESAGPILDYLIWFRKLVDAAGTHPTCFASESALCLTPDVAREVLGYFDRAEALAKSDVVRDRVEKASLSAMRAALSVCAMRLKVRDGLCSADTQDFPPDLLDRYARLCDKYDVPMDSESVSRADYVTRTRDIFAGMKAVTIENDRWRVSLLPALGARLAEMVYKPTGRNVIEAPRALDRFRYEPYVRDGVGPDRHHVYAYAVTDAHPDRVTAATTVEDGTRFVYTVSLAGDAVRFDMEVTAGKSRSIDPHVHPEYFTATTSEDPNVLSVYVRKGGAWVQPRTARREIPMAPDQEALIRNGAAGGAFAYFNHAAGFGVEQTFDPAEYAELGFSWLPSRLEVNLEMFPKPAALASGDQKLYRYEVRYLTQPPMK